MASVFNQVKIELSRAGLVRQQYEINTKVRVAIDVLDHEHKHDARTQSLHLTAARKQLAVGRRGPGPDNTDSSAPSARLSWLHIMREYTEQQLIVLGSGALLKKIPREAPRHVSSRPDSERRLGCLSPGPSEVLSTRRWT